VTDTSSHAPAHRRHALRRLVIPALLTLLVSCAAPPPKQQPPSAEEQAAASIEQANRLADEGRTLAAVRIYRDLAEKAAPAERQRWRLRIVELLFERGYPELALEWHDKLDAHPVPRELRTRKQIVDAQAAVVRRQGIRALRLLPAIKPDMEPALETRILATRADAYQLTGQPGRALVARVQREPLLDSEAAIEDNHAAIWSLLESIPVHRLERLARVEDAPIVRGWVELARSVRSARLGERPVTGALAEWRNEFPDHPAAGRFLTTLRERVAAELKYPERIAVLLPLSGQLEEPATAIRDGLLTAFYDQPAHAGQPDIRVYDTGEDGMSAAAAYDKAVAQGASFVIGPLQKESVAELAGRMKLQIPVLSLNYLPDGSVRPPDNLYQFGLLPEDEARQSAEAAIQNVHFNALALVPAGDWGGRMLEAFRQRFSELGGVLLESARYNGRASDYGRPIQALLNLDSSHARRRRLQATIGRSLKFEPRRRQDVEMVFVAAMPRQARLIEPQLEFHRAGDVPAYATSHIFTGTPDPDRDWDMNGLYFTETPWILENLDQPDGAYARIAAQWPNRQKRFPRLYALGADAFSILPHLDRMRHDPTSAITGHTGRLTMDNRNRIRRQLRWAEFVKGEPRPIPRPEAPTEDERGSLGQDVRDRAEGS